MGKASLPKSGINDTLDANRERKKQFGRERAAFSGVQGTSSTIGGGFNTTGNNTVQAAALSTAGGTMTGPLAFYPATSTITDDYISVSATGAHSSRVYIIGESSAADNLETINGPIHAGQILFFQPIIAAITLQDKTKAGTAWADATAYVAGDVRVVTGVRYVCHTAHTSATATNKPGNNNWADFWYINNIRITGTDDREVAVDEIILLQYDTTDGVWTIISGGGGSGAGLADNNVWTGTNTFQSAVSMTGASVIIGDAATDLLYITSTISQDVNFGGNDIDNLDRLNFKETSQRLDSTPTGIEYEVPSGENHEFLVNSTIIADFDSNGLTMVGSHDLNISSGDLTNGSGHNGNFTWSGTGNFSVYADDAYLYSATTWIGNYGGSDLCKIAAMVDFRDHTSSTNQTVPTQSDGYIEVKIGGLTKKLFYYS